MGAQFSSWVKDIADLSLYGIGSANNGKGTNGSEVELTGAASSGDFIYVAYEASTGDFNSYFGFDPNTNMYLSFSNI